MMDYGADQDIQWNSVVKKAWSNRNLGFSYNMQKYVKFAKKVLSQKSRSQRFQRDIKTERVTAGNIQELFKKYDVPKDFDLLSIDIDFNDYWVWKAITDYSPRVVVIEYNSSIPPTESRAVPYDPDARWDGTSYFGASLLALQNLGLKKGYTLVGCNDHGVNAFFCKRELVERFKIKGIQELYRPPKYGEIVNGKHIGHPPSNKTMIEV